MRGNLRRLEERSSALADHCLGAGSPSSRGTWKGWVLRPQDVDESLPDEDAGMPIHTTPYRLAMATSGTVGLLQRAS